MIINKGQKVDGDPGSTEVKARYVSDEKAKEINPDLAIPVLAEVDVNAPAPRQTIPLKANVSAAPEAKEAPLSPASTDPKLDALMALVATMAKQLEISAQREARLKKQEDAEDARKQARVDQYKANRSDDEKTTLIRQAKCSHQKGGKSRRANAVDNFNVSFHVFVTGEAVIKCLSCGMKWRVTDTKDRVVRNGNVYKNHTNIGWAEALLMTKKSDNTMSMSEIPASNLHKVKVDLPRQISDKTADIDTEPIGVFEEVEA